MSCDDIYLPDPSKFNVTITSQADIDNGPLREYNNNNTLILVHGAKGTLNFTNLTAFSIMNVSCNDELEKIIFPNTVDYGGLGIYEAPLLTEIDINEANGPFTGLRIHKTPRLGQDPDVQLFYNHDILILGLNDAGNVEFPNLTSVKTLSVVDTNASFPKLETITLTLDVAYPHKGYSDFLSLQNVTNVAIGNGSYSDEFGTAAMLGYGQYSPNLAVENSLVLGPWGSSITPDWTGNATTQPLNLAQSELVLDQLSRVGGDLNITKNSGIRKLSFDRLASVKRLNIMDNPNSTVPGDFSSLTTANSIHINGVIDKYAVEDRTPCDKKNRAWLTRDGSTTSPALFPRLSSAGEVIIKAWNSEFDCSRLVRMYDKGTIRYLSCNGTNGVNGGKNGARNSNNAHSGLTTTVSAGIGAGIGAAVLGIIAVLAWFILRYRRKLRGLEESHNNGRDDPKEAIRGTASRQEAQLDDTHIREAGGDSLPHQSGGAEILEAGERALRAEAGDGCVADGDVVASPQEKTSPAELP
ncbi:hypothetical protein PG997_002311 [Apiospora hydei]|uniref:Uncharacterized protein n=1 Tax=Apiospora hydei TaxID=1337664 RepID=A0ABR1X946_9PEZI